jgi:hypothetical protein
MNGIQRHSLSQHDSRILFARRFTKNRIKKCTFACMALAALGYICPSNVNPQSCDKLVKLSCKNTASTATGWMSRKRMCRFQVSPVT